MNQRRTNEEKGKLGHLFSKFKIQQLIERPLIKYGIDLNSFAYNIILSLPDIKMNDIFINKKGDRICLGFVKCSLNKTGDLKWDEVMIFYYNDGFWIPIEIEKDFLEKEDFTEETFEGMIDDLKPWLDEGELKNGVYLDSNGEPIHI